jgi:hypothetical protein
MIIFIYCSAAYPGRKNGGVCVTGRKKLEVLASESLVYNQVLRSIPLQIVIL